MSWLLPLPCPMEISQVSVAQFCSTGIQEQGNSKVSNGTTRNFHLLPCQAAFAGARSNCVLLDCFSEMSCCLLQSEKINTHISEISPCLASLAVSAEGPRETNGPYVRENCSAPSGVNSFSPKLSTGGARYGNIPLCSCCSVLNKQRALGLAWLTLHFSLSCRILQWELTWWLANTAYVPGSARMFFTCSDPVSAGVFLIPLAYPFQNFILSRVRY